MSRRAAATAEESHPRVPRPTGVAQAVYFSHARTLLPPFRLTQSLPKLKFAQVFQKQFAAPS
jgi:hypothetical protein